MRAFLLALAFAAAAAQAETRVLVVDVDPPGEVITLARDEVVWVRIAYNADEPVRIWARPYLDGKEVHAHSNPSVLHQGTGYALGWFRFPKAAQADEVRILASVPNSARSAIVARHPLRITATGEAGASRVAAPWVDEMRRENDAKARAEREARANEPMSLREAVVVYGFGLLVFAVVLAVPALAVWAVWKAAKGELRIARADYVPYAVSALSGILVCFALSAANGGREAVDSPLYFPVGVPALALIIFAISWSFPTRPWRWTLAMAAGQMLAMTLSGSSLSLWPIAILFMLFYSLPQFAAGFVASRLARRKLGV